MNLFKNSRKAIRKRNKILSDLDPLSIVGPRTGEEEKQRGGDAQDQQDRDQEAERVQVALAEVPLELQLLFGRFGLSVGLRRFGLHRSRDGGHHAGIAPAEQVRHFGRIRQHRRRLSDAVIAAGARHRTQTGQVLGTRARIAQQRIVIGCRMHQIGLPRWTCGQNESSR